MNKTIRLRALLVAVVALAATPAFAQETLTLSVYGIAQDGYKRDLYDPFQAQCGCKIATEAGNSEERIAKMEARKDNPEIDLAVLSDFDALNASRKGLIDPIDVSKLPNLAKLYDFAKDPLGGHLAVASTFYATSIIYRTDKLQVTSWKDLWKPELKGRLALPNVTTTQGPLLLAMAEKAWGGTSPDMTTAIDKIAAIKGDVTTFYTSSATLAQLFQQDEIYASVIGRFSWASFTKLGMKIGWANPSEGQTGGMNVLVMPKGSKHKDLAYKMLDYWLSTEVQTKLAMDLIDSPANAEVKVPDNVANALTYGADTAKAVQFIPPAEVLDHRAAWVAAWNQKVAH